MPVEKEAGAMPTDDSSGLDDDEDVGPAGPTTTKGCSEKSVQPVQYWPRPFAFENGDLLSEGEDFQGGVAATSEEDPDDGQECEYEREHEPIVVT